MSTNSAIYNSKRHLKHNGAASTASDGTGMVWYHTNNPTYIVVIAHVFRLTFSSTHLVVSLIRLVVTEHKGRKHFDGMVRY